MTIVAADTAGLRRAGRVLDAAGAVILPLPTPLPYIVASLDAATVNAAKRRPSGQPVGLTDFSLMTPHVDLDADTPASPAARHPGCHLNRRHPAIRAAPDPLLGNTGGGH